MTLQVAQRGGIRLAYERRGPANGQLAVLIQGLGMPGRMWLGLPGSLLRRGYRVITPDHRGLGVSETGWLPARSTAELADDVAAVIDHADAGPALVVGISLGGMIAQQLALRHQGKVRCLVLAATSCGFPHGRGPSLSTMSLLIRSLLSTSPITRAMIQRRLVHPDSLRRHPQLFRQWSRQLATERARPAVLLGQLAAAATHSTGRLLHRISCPTEVVTGDRDEIVPPVNSLILARLIPEAVLTVVARAGHVFPLEWPAALPAAVVRAEKRV